MITPVSFTVRPPSQASSTSQAQSNGRDDERSSSSSSSPTTTGSPSVTPFRISTAPIRPSPLSNSSYNRSVRRDEPIRRSAFGGDDDEDDRDGHPSRPGRSGVKGKDRRDQAITGFNDRGGVQSLEPEVSTGPLIIPSLPNRDWRQSSFAKAQRKPTYMPEGGPRVLTADDLVERTGDDVVQGGLQRVVRENNNAEVVSGEQPRGDVEMRNESEGQATPSTPLSLEQQALQAVLATGTQSNPDDPSVNLTISVQTDTLNYLDRPVQGTGVDETDAFRKDILTRPEESTMEDYDAVPIESFGAALLRGMGWTPGKGTSPGIHEPKRRPAGLGLGASEKPGQGQGQAEKKGDESGSRAERDKKRREDYATRGGRGYVPVIKRARESHLDSGTNSRSRTGSPAALDSLMIRSRATSRSPSPRSEGSRRRDRDGSERTGTGGRGESRDDYRSTRKEGEREHERERDRDRDRDREGRSSRYDSDRERDRGERGNRDRDRERERDSRDSRDSYRDKERDRYRERDRDRDRERDGDRDWREDDRDRDRERDRGHVRDRDFDRRRR